MTSVRTLAAVAIAMAGAPAVSCDLDGIADHARCSPFAAMRADARSMDAENASRGDASAQGGGHGGEVDTRREQDANADQGRLGSEYNPSDGYGR